MSKVTDQEEIQQQADMKAVLSTENGRRFVWRLLGHCGIYRDFEGETNDIIKQIGKRSVGLFVLGIISEKNEDMVFKMMKEAKTKQQEIENASESERRGFLRNGNADEQEYFGSDSASRSSASDSYAPFI